MKQILFRGAATALVTPMQPDGSLDLETLSRLTEWQIQSSISALVPCGTTGEAATLTDEERFTVIQTVAKTAAGRVPVIAGAGCNDTARAEQNCLAAAAAGADALLLVPGSPRLHFRPQQSASPQHRSPLSGDLAERSTGSPFPALFPSSLDEIPLLRGQPHPCQSCHAACWFPLWQLPHATFPHRTGAPCITATTIYYDETTRTLLNSACHRGAFAL